MNFIGRFFLMKLLQANLFRLTRNAEISLEEEGAHDLAKEMGSVLGEKKSNTLGWTWRRASIGIYLKHEGSCWRNISQVYLTSLPLGFGGLLK